MRGGPCSFHLYHQLNWYCPKRPRCKGRRVGGYRNYGNYGITVITVIDRSPGSTSRGSDRRCSRTRCFATAALRRCTPGFAGMAFISNQPAAMTPRPTQPASSCGAVQTYPT